MFHGMDERGSWPQTFACGCNPRDTGRVHSAGRFSPHSHVPGGKICYRARRRSVVWVHVDSSADLADRYAHHTGSHLPGRDFPSFDSGISRRTEWYADIFTLWSLLQSLTCIRIGVLIVVAYSIAAWVGVGCYYATNPAFQWRFPLALQCLWPLLMLVAMPLIPESPRWSKSCPSHITISRVLTATVSAVPRPSRRSLEHNLQVARHHRDSTNVCSGGILPNVTTGGR